MTFSNGESSDLAARDDAAEALDLFGNQAGVGLWDAIFHDGDPMHPESVWWWSGQFRRLLGFDTARDFPNEVHSWSDRLHPEDAIPTLAAFGAFLADRSNRISYDVRYRLRMRDGSYRWFRAIGGCKRDLSGKALRACGSLIDIHQEKMVTAARDDAADALDLYGNQAGVGLWDASFYNSDPMHPKSLWWWSGQFRRLLGFDTARDFPNEVHSWSDRLHPEDAAPTLAAFGAFLADRSGRTPYDVRYRLRIRDGSYRWFRAIGGCKRDLCGWALRACGSLVDIHQEEGMKAEKLASLGQLVAGVAHELNTPLGNMLMVATTLESRIDDFREQMRAGRLQRAVLEDFIANSLSATRMLTHGAQYAAELIANFKQVAIDQSSLRRRRFDLAVVIRETLSALQNRLNRTSVEVVLEIPDGISMDNHPGPIEQILTNLILNSLLHAFEEGASGLIRITARTEGKRLLLRYEDNGCGMPEEIASRAFDPFFTTKFGQGGSGLGLYIVYNLVTDLLRGSVKLVTHPAAGVSFELSFPLDAPPSDPAGDPL